MCACGLGVHVVCVFAGVYISWGSVLSGLCVYVCVCVHACVCVLGCACACDCVHTCMCVFGDECVYVCVCVCACMRMCTHAFHLIDSSGTWCVCTGVYVSLTSVVLGVCVQVYICH